MFITKVFAKSFFVIVIMKMINISCDDHYFIVNKYNGSEFFCVTNSSSALSWIIEDAAKKENSKKQAKVEFSVSSFFPPSYNFWTGNCSGFQQQGWTCLNSISDKIILDRRWENFDIYKTDYNETPKSLIEFTTIAKNLESNFTIPLSIRIKREAHVYFCDEENATSSNCYWFNLMGFGGKKLVVKKCKNTIPSKNSELPKCIHTFKEDPVSKTRRFLTNKTWNHFLFKKINNRITLEDVNGKEIIGFTDKNLPYTVRNMIICSIRNVGLWKLHELNYFYINETKMTEFKDLKPINEVVCISGFVRMCLKCTIKLELKNKNGTILRKETYNQTSDWKEVKIYETGIKTKVTLIITTINSDENNAFWELDDIKQCSSQGFRVIYTRLHPNCQLMSSKTKPLELYTSQSSLSNTKITCKENTVSTNCVPCSVFMEQSECGNLKICESSGTSQQCWCSAGYIMNSTTKYCTKNCTIQGSYGHQCQHKCSVQCKNCHPITGKCDSCTNEYSGDRCQFAPTLFTENVPKVVDFSYTNVTIRVPEIKSTVNSASKSQKYIVKYKEKNSKCKWGIIKNNNYIRKQKTFLIENLQAGVSYTVRFSFNDGKFHDVEVNTKCDDMKSNNVEFEPISTSITIFPNEKQQFKLCPDIWKSVDIKVQETEQSFQKSFYERSKIQITGLKPLTNYTIIFKDTNTGSEIFNKTVKTTKKGPSGPPIDLNVNWSIENNLEITWKHPVKTNNDIKCFNISVVPKNEKNRTHYIHTILNISSSDHNKTLYHYTIEAKNLLASKRYIIRVQAYNGLNVIESSITDVSPPEIPTLETDPEISLSTNIIHIKTSRIQNFNSEHKYKLFLFMDENKNNSHYQNELKEFQKKFDISLSRLKLFYECSNYENSTQFTIGITNHSANGCNSATSVEVTSGITYNITILLVHSHSTKSDTSSYKLYSFVNLIPSKSGFNLTLLTPLLLLIIPIAIFIYISRRRKNKKTKTIRISQKRERASTQPLLRTTICAKENDISGRNLQHLIENKILRQQHQKLLQLFPNTYEKLPGTLELDFQHLDLNLKNNIKIAKAYIVCDFPKPEQTSSFWNLIWKEEIKNIVLLDNICIQEIYWPTLKMKLVYRNFSVQCVWEKVFPEYEFRKFIITGKGVFTVNLFRFTSWSDQDLPDHLTCLHFFKKISEIQIKPKSPILFHSRIGLKATGFAVLCDMSVRNGEKDQPVDVFRTALQLAEYSTKLVDDYECYELAHFVILECLLASDVDIDVDFDFQDLIVESLFKNDKFQKYLTYMNNTKWIDRNREISRESYSYCYVDGQQYVGTTLLKPLNIGAEIKAILQNFGGITIQKPNGKKFVLIRQPTSKEAKQIWTIVIEMKIFDIMILNKIEDPRDRFWTKRNNLVNLGKIAINNTYTQKLHSYDWTNITILVNGEKKERKLDIFEIQNWSAKSLCPPNVYDFVSCCLETYSRTNNSDPMLVICRDGTTASSLYTAIYYNIHKIQKEQKLDVCTSARLVRKYCTEFTENEEQLNFLWEATKECAHQQSLYQMC